MFVETVSSAKKKVLFVKYKRGIMLAEPRCAFWNLVCHQADNAGVAGPGAAWVTGLGVLPLTSPPWALHPFHSFPHETGKHRHDHFGVHFHQVFWEGIHSCSNFSGHGDGIPKKQKTGQVRTSPGSEFQSLRMQSRQNSLLPVTSPFHLRKHTLAQQSSQEGFQSLWKCILCKNYVWISNLGHQGRLTFKSLFCILSEVPLYDLSLETSLAPATFETHTGSVCLGYRAWQRKVTELNKELCWEKSADDTSTLETFL